MFHLRMGEIFEGQSVDKEVILVSLKNLIDTCCVVAMSCLTFCYPMGFRRQDYWSGLPFPPPGNLPHPEIKSASPPLLLCSHSVISNSLKPHGLQHSRLPCPLPSPGVCSNSRPLSQLMPSNHLILCHLLLLLPLIFPSIMVFSKDSALHIRWPKYWSFSFSTSPSNEYSGLISFRIDWFNLLAIQGTWPWNEGRESDFSSLSSYSLEQDWPLRRWSILLCNGTSGRHTLIRHVFQCNFCFVFRPCGRISHQIPK